MQRVTILAGSSQSLISDSGDSEFYRHRQRKEAVSADVHTPTFPIAKSSVFMHTRCVFPRIQCGSARCATMAPTRETGGGSPYPGGSGWGGGARVGGCAGRGVAALTATIRSQVQSPSILERTQMRHSLSLCGFCANT